MASEQTLAGLRDRGVVLQPHEAVSIAQQLIHPLCPPNDGPTAFAGPPSPENVVLRSDGSVECGCDATPAISEVAILLQSLLPAGPGAPGALRYTIARALLDVEAPPFDSLDELSQALTRFERGDRREVVRNLLARAGCAVAADGDAPAIDAARMAAHAAGAPVAADRRRVSLTPFDIRRELREMDRMRFEERAVASCTCAADAPRRRRRWLPAAAVLAAASVGGGAVELAHRHAVALARQDPLSPAITRAAAPPAPPADALSVAGPQSGSAVAGERRPSVPDVTRAAIGTSGTRHAVRNARAELTTPRPRAKKPANSRIRPRSRQSQPSAIMQVLRFKWLKDAFSQKD